jgi:RNA polymerase sigma-70 factor (ECF subfamily)
MTVGLMSVEPAIQRDAPEADEWVARFRAGDGTAFDRLVAWYEPHVRRVAERLLGESHVDDVVQDVFLAALRQLKGFRGESRLSTWLTGITLRQCRRRQRWQYRWMNMLRRRALHVDEPSASPADSGSLQDERAAEVRRAVTNLPALLREVVVLRYQQQLSIVEMVAVLKTPRGTIEVRLNRARAELSKALANLVEQTP